MREDYIVYLNYYFCVYYKYNNNKACNENVLNTYILTIINRYK